MHHLACGISSLLYSVNLILFTVLLVHLILRISPHHSHHLRSHHLSLPLPFTPDLKLISFTNPFLHSHSYSFRTAFVDPNLYWIKGALLFVLVSATCARLSCILSFRVHVKLFYHIVLYRIVCIFNLSCVLYFPVWINVNSTVFLNCADVTLRIYSLM